MFLMTDRYERGIFFPWRKLSKKQPIHGAMEDLDPGLQGYSATGTEHAEVTMLVSPRWWFLDEKGSGSLRNGKRRGYLAPFFWLLGGLWGSDSLLPEAIRTILRWIYSILSGLKHVQTAAPSGFVRTVAQTFTTYQSPNCPRPVSWGF